MCCLKKWIFKLRSLEKISGFKKSLINIRIKRSDRQEEIMVEKLKVFCAIWNFRKSIKDG